MLTSRRAPLVTVDRRHRFGLDGREYTALLTTLVRYYGWLASDRQLDPWESGYGGPATRYDRPRSKHHKPSGGYGPGVAAEPIGVDAELLRVDAYLGTLKQYERRLLSWRCYERLTTATCAARLGLTERVLAEQWSRIVRDAYAALFGG